MGRKKRNSKILELAYQRLNGMKSIDPNLDLGGGLTVSALEAAVNSLRARLDSYNQKLSEQRGVAVRNYLTQQGIAPGSVTTEGFGKTKPVVSNDTSAGRQQNRRVELVVSGDIIGGHIGSPRASR